MLYWDSDSGLVTEKHNKTLLASIELKPDHCIVPTSLRGKQMSEPLPHRAWEEGKEIPAPFMSRIVQNCLG